ncbi:hypothetical protein D9M68_979820 [compost metagenome]
MQHGGMFHETGDHPAVQRRQDRVADAVFIRRQAKDHVITQAQAFDTKQLGIGDQTDQRVVIILLVGLAHQLIEVQATHAPPP